MASDAPGHLGDSLWQSLAEARVRLAVSDRAESIRKKLHSDLESFGAERRQGMTHGSSPIEALKIEALATVMALAATHCEASQNLAMSGDVEESHLWAVDEGFLKAAFSLILSVQLPVSEDTDD